MPLKQRLGRIINSHESRAGKWFDGVMMLLIVFSILAMGIETLPGLEAHWKSMLFYAEVTVTTIFLIEYLLRIWVAHRKHDYIFSFYGIIDFLSIVPFMIEVLLGAVGWDSRALRIVRLLRAVRLLKVARYSQAMNRFKRSFEIVREELFLYLMMAVTLFYLAAMGIYHYEHEAQPELFSSVFHSMWWSLVTLTTVGYGDVYPVTLGGRIFTFFVLMCGLGIVAIPAGLLASALTQARKEEKSARFFAETLGKTALIKPYQFTGERAWAAQRIGNFNGTTIKLHWADEPMYRYEDNSEEILIVVDGTLEVSYTDKGSPVTKTLEKGDIFFSAKDEEFKVVPQGEVRVVMIEK